jgi:8-oxo-dGTP pyrophosphatase MutT (NUDIX family)
MPKGRLAMSGSATEIAPARPSSTVVLAREADGAPELFLVQRPAKAAFGAAYVFPGGVVDDADAAVHARCAGVDTGTANRRLNVDSGGLDYYSAAIRELFEETGVLLGTCSATAAALDDCRRRLNAMSLGWAEFLAAHDVVLDAAALHYFSHWITPNARRKRFTTRFFVAELPAGQVAVHDPGELTDSRWLSAEAALDAARDGDIELRLPTLKTLESLAPHGSVADLIDWARRCESTGVETIHPVMPPGPD